ncbi:MAG: DUF4350 domain-containing protein [bacterium]|nr:DUF4350 domain-containing protein [bacterium]
MKKFKKALVFTSILLFILLILSCAKDESIESPTEPTVPEDSVLVLFDKGNGELAGNADWTIGSPPSYIGGYSDFGQSLRDAGFETESINYISDSTLTGAKVLVLAEPNTQLSTSSINSILSFVNAGGGLLIIGNHEGSDRNGDGWDSGDVLNEFSPDNFGITFVADSFLEDIGNIETQRSAITAGISMVGCYVGCTLSVSGDAQGRIWRNGAPQGKTQIFVASSFYGNGKIVAVGDSAIFDDGTGAVGEDLHNDWVLLDNAQLGINIIKWLAE